MTVPIPPGRLYGETERRISCGGLILSESSYSAGRSTPKHAHEAPLFYFVVGGTCIEETSGGVQQHHARSTLVYRPAGEPHATHWPETPGACFHLEFTGANWAARFADSKAQLSAARIFAGGLPVWLGRRLRNELFSGDDLTPLAIEGMALELLAETARAERLRTPSQETPPKTSRPPRWLEAVHQRAQDEFNISFSLAEFAETAGVQPSSLARAFRRQYGCTLGEYHAPSAHRTRLPPCSLSSDVRLSRTSPRWSAFADQSHFTRAFTAQIGIPPARYRSGMKTRRSS